MRVPAPAAHLSDRQRLNRVSPTRPVSPVPVHDRPRQVRAPTRPRPPAPPAAVSYNTLVINGENDSRWQIMFGDGHQVSIVNLADYRVHADIGHRVYNLTGILPDAIGIDLNVGAGVHAFSMSGGVNFIWHTRGDVTLFPEVHFYKGTNLGFAKGITSAGTDASVGGALLLAWATAYDTKGKASPAPSTWVANGYNWTGYFWSAALSIPTPWGFNATVSYFTSDWRPMRRDNTVWWGVSVGASRSLQPTGNMPSKAWDIAKLLAGKTGLALSQQEYYLVYGNGKDYLLDQRGRPTKSISGWQWFIDQNEYNKK